MKLLDVLYEFVRKQISSAFNSEFDTVADIKFGSLPRESKEDCIFNQFARGAKTPEDLILDSPTMMCFHDYRPAAEFHILVIPKEPIHSVLALRPDEHDIQMLRGLIQVGQETMAELTGDQNGDFIMGFHIPPANSVDHIHLHVVSGRLNRTARLKFPPGNRFFYADALKVVERLTQLQAET